LVPFHHEDPSLWPYPRAPLDDRDDIVELDFADTSALSDVDAFERRRQNGKNGGKLSKKDRAREREEIERSWDVPGGVSVNVVNAGSPQQAGLGRPSPVPARTGVPAGGSGASPSPQPGILRVNQSNATSAPVKAPESSTGGQATVLPSGNKFKSKSNPKPVVNSNANGPNGKVALPVPNAAQTNGSAAVSKLAVSAAIVEAAHSHTNGAASLHTKDRNEFVREVLTLIHVRFVSSLLHVYVLSFTPLFFFLLVVVSIDGSLVRGSTLGGISCAGLVFVDQETHRFCWRGRCLCFPFLHPFARVLGVASKY